MHLRRGIATGAELLPLVAARHPDAVDDTTLFGHSLGGLFAVHVLLTQGSMFGRYIVSSPSLWWDRGKVFDLARTAGELTGSMFVGIGGLETDAGLDVDAVEVSDEFHATVPGTVLSRGLRSFYG